MSIIDYVSKLFQTTTNLNEIQNELSKLKLTLSPEEILLLKEVSDHYAQNVLFNEENVLGIKNSSYSDNLKYLLSLMEKESFTFALSKTKLVDFVINQIQKQYSDKISNSVIAEWEAHIKFYFKNFMYNDIKNGEYLNSLSDDLIVLNDLSFVNKIIEKINSLHDVKPNVTENGYGIVPNAHNKSAAYNEFLQKFQAELDKHGIKIPSAQLLSDKRIYFYTLDKKNWGIYYKTLDGNQSIIEPKKIENLVDISIKKDIFTLSVNNQKKNFNLNNRNTGVKIERINVPSKTIFINSNQQKGSSDIPLIKESLENQTNYYFGNASIASSEKSLFIEGDSILRHLVNVIKVIDPNYEFNKPFNSVTLNDIEMLFSKISDLKSSGNNIQYFLYFENFNKDEYFLEIYKLLLVTNDKKTSEIEYLKFKDLFLKYGMNENFQFENKYGQIILNLNYEVKNSIHSDIVNTPDKKEIDTILTSLIVSKSNDLNLIVDLNSHCVKNTEYRIYAIKAFLSIWEKNYNSEPTIDEKKLQFFISNIFESPEDVAFFMRNKDDMKGLKSYFSTFYLTNDKISTSRQDKVLLGNITNDFITSLHSDIKKLIVSQGVVEKWDNGILNSVVKDILNEQYRENYLDMFSSLKYNINVPFISVQNFSNLDSAKTLLSSSLGERETLLFTDDDLDGRAAFAIGKYLKYELNVDKFEVQFREKNNREIDAQQVLSTIRTENPLLIFADMGASSFQAMNEILTVYPKAEIIIADHHPVFDIDFYKNKNNVHLLHPNFTNSYEIYNNGSHSGAYTLGTLFSNYVQDIDSSKKDKMVTIINDIAKNSDYWDMITTEKRREENSTVLGQMGTLLNKVKYLQQLSSYISTNQKLYEDYTREYLNPLVARFNGLNELLKDELFNMGLTPISCDQKLIEIFNIKDFDSEVLSLDEDIQSNFMILFSIPSDYKTHVHHKLFSANYDLLNQSSKVLRIFNEQVLPKYIENDKNYINTLNFVVYPNEYLDLGRKALGLYNQNMFFSKCFLHGFYMNGVFEGSFRARNNIPYYTIFNDEFKDELREIGVSDISFKGHSLAAGVSIEFKEKLNLKKLNTFAETFNEMISKRVKELEKNVVFMANNLFSLNRVGEFFKSIHSGENISNYAPSVYVPLELIKKYALTKQADIKTLNELSLNNLFEKWGLSYKGDGILISKSVIKYLQEKMSFDYLELGEVPEYLSLSYLNGSWTVNGVDNVGPNQLVQNIDTKSYNIDLEMSKINKPKVYSTKEYIQQISRVSSFKPKEIEVFIDRVKHLLDTNVINHYSVFDIEAVGADGVSVYDKISNLGVFTFSYDNQKQLKIEANSFLFDVITTLKASNLTSLTPEVLKRAFYDYETVDEYLSQYLKSKEKGVFLAHNINYDIGIMNTYLPKTTKVMIEENLVCDTQQLVKRGLVNDNTDYIKIDYFPNKQDNPTVSTSLSIYPRDFWDSFVKGKSYSNTLYDYYGKVKIENKNNVLYFSAINGNFQSFSLPVENVKQYLFVSDANSSKKFSVEQVNMMKYIENMRKNKLIDLINALNIPTKNNIKEMNLNELYTQFVKFQLTNIGDTKLLRKFNALVQKIDVKFQDIKNVEKLVEYYVDNSLPQTIENYKTLRNNIISILKNTFLSDGKSIELTDKQCIKLLLDMVNINSKRMSYQTFNSSHLNKILLMTNYDGEKLLSEEKKALIEAINNEINSKSYGLERVIVDLNKKIRTDLSTLKDVKVLCFDKTDINITSLDWLVQYSKEIKEVLGVLSNAFEMNPNVSLDDIKLILTNNSLPEHILTEVYLYAKKGHLPHHEAHYNSVELSKGGDSAIEPLVIANRNDDIENEQLVAMLKTTRQILTKLTNELTLNTFNTYTGKMSSLVGKTFEPPYTLKINDDFVHISTSKVLDGSTLDKIIVNLEMLNNIQKLKNTFPKDYVNDKNQLIKIHGSLDKLISNNKDGLVELIKAFSKSNPSILSNKDSKDIIELISNLSSANRSNVWLDKNNKDYKIIYMLQNKFNEILNLHNFPKEALSSVVTINKCINKIHTCVSNLKLFYGNKEIFLSLEKQIHDNLEKLLPNDSKWFIDNQNYKRFSQRFKALEEILDKVPTMNSNELAFKLDRFVNLFTNGAMFISKEDVQVTEQLIKRLKCEYEAILPLLVDDNDKIQTINKTFDKCLDKLNNAIIVDGQHHHTTTKKFNGRGGAIPNVIMELVSTKENTNVIEVKPIDNEQNKKHNVEDNVVSR